MRIKNDWKKFVVLVCLLGSAGTGLAGEAPELETKPERVIESGPDWMKVARSGETGKRPVKGGHSAWRSTGALLVVLGGLMAAQVYLRRRAARPTVTGETRLNIVSRLRVGARQELIVVDWEGDRFILGVGPSFIQPVHHQKKQAEEG